MVRNLLAALLAAIFTLACSAEGSTEATPTDKVDVVETPETKVATLVIEIKGQTGTASPRRLGPPADTLTVNLYKDDDGANVPIEWTNGLAMAKVGVGKYTCEVIASGFAPETSPVEVMKENLGATVDVTISLSANGPTKPVPVDLGEYSVQRGRWIPPNQTMVGMPDSVDEPISVSFTEASGNQPATYVLTGYGMPNLICTQGSDHKVTCPNAQGLLSDQEAKGNGEFSADNSSATLYVDFTDYVGTSEENHTYSVYVLTR